MLAVQRECFEKDRRRNESPKNHIRPRQKRSSADKYFLLRPIPPASAGYGSMRGRQSTSSKRASPTSAKKKKKKKIDAISNGGPSAAQNYYNRNNEAGETYEEDDGSYRAKEKLSTHVQKHRLMMTPPIAVLRKKSSHSSNGFSIGVKDVLDDPPVRSRLGQTKQKEPTIAAFQKPHSLRPRMSQHSDRLRFEPNLSIKKGFNINREESEEIGGEAKVAKMPGQHRSKKLTKSQITSVDRLALSKWRRDPIHERLLFLTGHKEHQSHDPDYVKHLDSILQTKHDEKDAACMADLAETERHREWLWRVKYDLDFAEMEQESLDQHREERRDAAEAELNRQDAMYSSAGKQSFYTVAHRTHGLDKMRNIKALRAMHNDIMEDVVRKGLAHPRCTWLLHAIENEDQDLDQFLSAETILDIYLGSENVIQDTATLEEQNEDDQDEVNDDPGDIDDEEEDSY